MAAETTNAVASEPILAHRVTREADWYLPNIDRWITPELRKLLEDYSKVPPEQVKAHFYEAREKAWAVRPYPCIGLGGFAEAAITTCPIYPSIIHRLKEGAILVDIGCLLGADLRKVVFDGAPSNNLIGIDIVDGFWDLGFDFYNDKNRFPARFIQGDILNPNAALRDLEGKVDIINIQKVIHQWSWPGQVEAAKKLVPLTKPGSVIVGSQVGNTGAVKPEQNTKEYDAVFFHQSSETWKELWREVGDATQTKWTVQAALKTWEELGRTKEATKHLGEGSAMLQFVVTREE